MPFRPGESGNPAGRPKGTGRPKLRDVVEKLNEAGIHPVEAILELIPRLTPKDQLSAWRTLLEFSCPKPTVYLGNDPEDPLLPFAASDVPTSDLLARIEARKNATP